MEDVKRQTAEVVRQKLELKAIWDTRYYREDYE
jgi:hypothetical protein